jgi:hypothetical protein
MRLQNSTKVKYKVMGIWDTLAVQTMQQAGASIPGVVAENSGNLLNAASNVAGAVGEVSSTAGNPVSSQPVNQTMKALSGGVKGASALAPLGPVGMAAGFVGGSIFGAVMASKEEDDRRDSNALIKFQSSKASKPIPLSGSASQHGDRPTYFGEKFGIKENSSILENIQIT